MFWWGWDAGFEGERKRDTGFQFLPDLINCYWPALQTFCAYSCVRFQVTNSNGQCPVILHYHLITLVSWDYMKSFSTILIICVYLRQWHLSITDASVSNLGIPILSSFLVFRPFPERLASIATPFGGDSDLSNELCVSIDCEKGVCEGMPSFENKSSEPRFHEKWTRWKLWEILLSSFTGHLWNMGRNNFFLPLIRGEKKRKQ